MNNEIDAGEVIAALRRQIADLSYRLALAEAQLTQQVEPQEDKDATDGQA